LKTFCGSPTYTSPEIIQRKEYGGLEVDIWSLGVVLFVLVTGELPFNGHNFTDLFAKIIQGQYTLPEYLSDDCQDLISKMLKVEPNERLSLDNIRTHAWTSLDSGSVAKATIPEHVRRLEPSVDIIDKEILQLMEVQLGYSQEDTIEALTTGAYNDAAATYYLLVSKTAREQNEDTMDNIQQHPPKSITAPTTPQESPVTQHRIPPWRAGSKLKKIQLQVDANRRYRTLGTPIEVKTDKLKKSGRRFRPVQRSDSKESSISKESVSSLPLKNEEQQESVIPIYLTPPRASRTLNIPKSKEGTLSGSQGKGHRRPHSHDAADPRGHNTNGRTHIQDPKKSPPRRSKEGNDEMIIPVSQEEEMDNLVQQFLRTFDNHKESHQKTSPSPVRNRDKPRKVRIPLNTSTATHLPPETVLAKIRSVLLEKNLNFLYSSAYILSCKSPDLEFELEICALPNLDMHGIRFHRRSGDVWKYQEMCRQILEELKLGET
jgi:serine/threonine protein kinase